MTCIDNSGVLWVQKQNQTVKKSISNTLETPFAVVMGKWPLDMYESVDAFGDNINTLSMNK
jgi:hypothetical protein